MPKIPIAILILLLFTLASCADDPDLPTSNCGESFLYGSGEDIYTLRPIPGNVFIELQGPENPEAQIEALFAKYDFLDDTFFPQGNTLRRFPVLLKNLSCESLFEALKILNQNETISAATPRFEPEGEGVFNDKPWTLINGISIMPHQPDDEANIMEWANNNGLEYRDSSYGTLLFRVNQVSSGFEPLEIAIKAKDELDVRWALADFLIPIWRWQ
jgi:hypothetical protein